MLRYLLAGTWFGIILTKAEVISWWRIQEMFRLQSFHMYGVIGSAVVVGMISVFILRKFQIRTFAGEPLQFKDRKLSWGTGTGGFIFGLGWAITGACPGPLFAQLGSGMTVVAVTLCSAILGTWVYGAFRTRLPH